MKNKWCFCGVLVLGMSFSSVMADCFQGEADTISLEMKGVSIQHLMRSIALPKDCALVLGEGIKGGEVSMQLKGAPWFEAISIIAASNHLSMARLRHAIIVHPHKVKKSDFPMIRRLVHLKHIQAKTLIGRGGVRIKSLMSTDGRLVPVGKGDDVLIYEHMDKIQSVIDAIMLSDVRLPRLRIQAKLFYIEDELLSSIGVDWGISRGWRVALPGIDQEGWGMLHLNPQSLLFFEQSGRVKVIANPVISTMSGVDSSIESGEQVPYPQKTEHGDLHVSFKKAVLMLKVLPEILQNNRIKMDLTLNQDQVNPRMVQGVPSIQTQKLHTVVVVPLNQTVVLGGIYRESLHEGYKGIPFWKKYSWLTWLTGENDRSHKQEQLLLILTPSLDG